MVIAGAEGPKWGRSPALDIGRREFITLLGGAANDTRSTVNKRNMSSQPSGRKF
jgi:hypothetical protein